jgi:hypothetical protein
VSGLLHRRGAATTRRSWIAPLVGGTIGGAVMTAWLGLEAVDPVNIDWLMHDDFMLHFFGWHLYRHSPWSWPIGAAPLNIWPVGSSVGLTDSIPVAAIFFKLLNPLLPSDFQFIGLWLVLCFALQGVFGVLLMRIATARPLLQLLGACLFVLSPPLIFRYVHAALTAHWLLLASLWLILRRDGNVPSARLAAAWAAMGAVTAATQPYLLVMVVVLMAAGHAQQLIAHPRALGRIAVHAGAALAAAVVALWQSGSLMVRSEDGLEIGGFGAWSTNLLSFIMPTEAKTRFAPGWIRYEHVEQYEGYAYLGAGMLLLAAVTPVARVFSLRRVGWPRLQARYLPLVAGLILLAAMALGPTITLGPYAVFRYDVSWWGPLTIFRTNGRMIWPVYYAVVAAVLFAASRLPPRAAAALLTVALAAQAFDVSGSARYVGEARTYGFREPLTSEFWSVVPAHYRALVLVPSNLCGAGGAVNFVPFARLAGRVGVGVNAGITARYDVRAAERYCEGLRRELREGPLSDDVLYVIARDQLERVVAGAADKPRCTMIDGYGVCFSERSATAWQERFDVARARLPVRAELERFYGALDELYSTSLRRDAVPAPGRIAARMEGLAAYIADRVEGCTPSEAAARTLSRVASNTPSVEACAALAIAHEMPPVDETYAFHRRLDAAVGSTDRGDGSTHVDREGEAVWLHAYLSERLRGLREQDAREKVLNSVRQAAR